MRGIRNVLSPIIAYYIASRISPCIALVYRYVFMIVHVYVYVYVFAHVYVYLYVFAHAYAYA